LLEIQAVETKEHVKMLSDEEDLTDSQANTWIDSLIVSLVVPLSKLIPHRSMTRSMFVGLDIIPQIRKTRDVI